VGRGWRENLPDPVEIPLSEVSAVISDLDHLFRRAEVEGHADFARALDEVVGRMTRWIWPLLGELDDEDGYDG
jgi:hypothetical protein